MRIFKKFLSSIMVLSILAPSASASCASDQRQLSYINECQSNGNFIGEKWHTDRLVLNYTTEEDLDKLAPMLLDYDVTKFISLIPLQFRKEADAKSFLSGMLSTYSYLFTIKTKDTDKIIGQVGYAPNGSGIEISYWLGKKYQGKGFASEATLELSDYIFKQSSSKNFYIEFIKENTASKKLAFKIGEFMLKKNPSWEIVAKEDQEGSYEVSDISDKYVTLRQYSEDNKCAYYTTVLKSMFPDEHLILGKKIPICLSSLIIKKS